MRPIATLEVANRVRNDDYGIEHRPGGPKVRCPIADLAALFEQANHRLCAGEIAGAKQHDDPVARAVEDGHLAEFRVVVDASMGAGVGRENDSILQKDANTISHVQIRLSIVIEQESLSIIIPQ